MGLWQSTPTLCYRQFWDRHFCGSRMESYKNEPIVFGLTGKDWCVHVRVASSHNGIALVSGRGVKKSRHHKRRWSIAVQL